MAALAKSIALALVALSLAPSAVAGDVAFGISYGKHSQKPSLALHWSNPQCGPVDYPQKHVYSAPCPPKVWVPGHYKPVVQQVWVPGCHQQIWVEPVYQTHYGAYGKPIQVCVSQGHWKQAWVPGHYAPQTVKVFQPGGWHSPAY